MIAGVINSSQMYKFSGQREEPSPKTKVQMKGTKYKWKVQSTNESYKVHVTGMGCTMYTSTRNRMYFPIQSMYLMYTSSKYA